MNCGWGLADSLGWVECASVKWSGGNLSRGHVQWIQLGLRNKSNSDFDNGYYCINPHPAELIYLNFQAFEVVDRYALKLLISI